MAIKRGVSFYSYQQADFFNEMDYKDMIRELHDNLHCDGVEIINMNVVRDYPFPTKEWVAEWHNTMGRYDMKAIGFDGFLDTMRYRDHVLNYGEAAELIKLDLRLACELGFRTLRTMSSLPNAVAERCLETAEKVGVKIAWEIHAPLPIRPGTEKINKFRENCERSVFDTLEFIEKTGTKWLGFVPDFGIFCDGPYLGGVEAMLRRLAKRDGKLAEELTEVLAGCARTHDFSVIVAEKYKERLTPQEFRATAYRTYAAPEDLELILPYVCHFHGKAHNMTEIPGNPGHYQEPATMYKEVFDVLKRNNWDGYVCTEFEGQAAYGDLPKEQFLNEVEQVRRHHAMMRDLGAE